MAVRIVHFGLTLALLAAGLNGSLMAQRYRQWLEPYQEGKKAFEEGNYAEAAAHFQRALNADDKASPRKPTYGNFDEAYFPHLYLGVSLYHLGRFQEAQTRLAAAQAHGRLRGDEAALLQQYQGLVSQALQGNPAFDKLVEEVQGHLDAQRFQEALQSLQQESGLELDQQEGERLGQLRSDAQEGRFSQLVAQGQRLLNDGRPQQARSLFEQADRLIPGRPAVDQALRRIRQRQQAAQYDSVVEAARTALDQSPPDLDAALSSFQQALDQFPQRAADDGLKARVDLLELEQDCRQNFQQQRFQQASDACSRAQRDGSTLAFVDDYRGQSAARVLTGEARRAAQSGQMEEAIGLYRQALEADPEYRPAQDELGQAEDFQRRWRQADRLVEQGSRAGQIDRQALQSAAQIYRSLAGSDFAFAPASLRFDDDIAFVENRLAALDSTPASDSSSDQRQASQTLARDTLKKGLQALYQGQIESAIRELKRAQQFGIEMVDAHAYLGVAYATAALLNGEESYADYWNKAMGEFEEALRLESDYQLDENWVSPLVRKAFEMRRSS
ncbi:MAG TPA: hypothetical protein VLV83_10360 [Acidobacteriota bacterium]|nr:hypothetical protein [Acidobacteriota bacterium]